MRPRCLNMFSTRYRCSTTHLIGAEGTTLLKNTGGLPLQNPQRIAILGKQQWYAKLPTLRNCLRRRVYQNGTLSYGEGSGYACAPYVVTLDALKERAIQSGAEISAVTVIDNFESAIQSLVPTSDVTIVFVSGWATEFQDVLTSLWATMPMH
ncbi:hypothetical protein VKT23_007478 [Stygiomarasmius scandens]|uniref:beta-glucosidase n=1 Tax=Marasmiellus scandens TaxID=2682957 RepID=A0ABR1JR74_9AGAR